MSPSVVSAGLNKHFGRAEHIAYETSEERELAVIQQVLRVAVETWVRVQGDRIRNSPLSGGRWRITQPAPAAAQTDLTLHFSSPLTLLPRPPRTLRCSANLSLLGPAAASRFRRSLTQPPLVARTVTSTPADVHAPIARPSRVPRTHVSRCRSTADALFSPVSAIYAPIPPRRCPLPRPAAQFGMHCLN